MASANAPDFLPALIGELAAAIDAIGGTTITVAEGGGVAGQGWTLSLVATGALRGTARLTLDPEGVTALLHTVLGADADTSDSAARDLLTELTNQALSSLCLKPAFAGLTLSPGAIESTAVAPEQTTLFALTFGDHTLQAAATASLEAGSEAPAVASASRPPARRAAAGGPTTEVPTSNLEVVLDIELPLSVRFGSTVMSIRALSSIGPGSIVDMGRSPDDPVEVLVCGRPIAKAEVVIVAGNYGVRITDLTSPMERIRAMEGQL